MVQKSSVLPYADPEIFFLDGGVELRVRHSVAIANPVLSMGSGTPSPPDRRMTAARHTGR